MGNTAKILKKEITKSEKKKKKKKKTPDHNLQKRGEKRSQNVKKWST